MPHQKREKQKITLKHLENLKNFSLLNLFCLQHCIITAKFNFGKY